MRSLLTIILIMFSSVLFSQEIYYVGDIDPDPALEREKIDKKAYFARLRTENSRAIEYCLRSCGHNDPGHAHDANHPEPCYPLPSGGVMNPCECNCEKSDNSSNIDRQENDWGRDFDKRQEAYRQKKMKEQQDASIKQQQIEEQQNLQNEHQAAVQAEQNEYDRFMADQQQRYEQNQQDFSNAQSASDNAYQSAISSGKKTSGAMLDATLAGASQISDPTTALGYTGVGLAFSLIAYAGEKKQERLDAEAAAQREAEEIQREEQRKLMIIDAKDKFVADALTINQYAFSDLISKDRYAALLLVPDDFNWDKQAIYFSIPVKVQQYSDNTYPLKDKIEKELLLCIDKSVIQGKNIYTLYPIVNIDKFENDFTKKMGSSHLIYLDAEMIKFKKMPFYDLNESNAAGTDFWGNPVTKKKVESSPQKKPAVPKEDFWDH